MLYLSKKNILFMLFVLIAYLSSSCQKDQISPANQEVAFVKYYGHVGDQTATDVIPTSDGGYVLLGSTNSYSAREEMDILVVKTDSLGNELWSSAFGRTEGEVDPDFRYLRFSEEGIRIIELPDQSAYVLAANRTYYDYPSASSEGPVGESKTKIVLYQLDYATGAPTSTSGIELMTTGTNSPFTEKVSDMKLDTAGGGVKFILTGYTKNIKPNKPDDDYSGFFDEKDVFTVLLNADFSIDPSWLNFVYGFAGSDYGTSVQITSEGYLICGISDFDHSATGQAADYVPSILVVLIQKSGGTPLNEKEYALKEYHFGGGYSVFDADNNKLTIAVNVDNALGANAEKGNVGLFQIQLSSINFTVVTPNSTDGIGCQYYDLGDINGSTGKEHLVESIALLPGDEGFILSTTQKSSLFESDICIAKFDRNLNVEEGWPYYFGYSDKSSLVLTNDKAGSVIPIISGTGNQINISGYAFTGRFGLGTNEMMGLVKLNLNGTLTP